MMVGRHPRLCSDTPIERAFRADAIKDYARFLGAHQPLDAQVRANCLDAVARLAYGLRVVVR